MLLELLGLTPEQIAEGESWDPKKGKRTKDLGDRVGDGIMSVLTGTNYGERVQEATKGQYLENMQDLYGDRINKTKNVTGYQSIGNLTRLTDRKINQELENREKTQAARSKAAATTGLSRDNFLESTDPGTILASATKLVKDEKDQKERDLLQKDEDRYRDTRKDKADANAILLMNMENNQANLRADRELRRDQQAYQNRALDLKEARMDRRDRQAAIQQMMAGLAQLGASIAI